MASPLLDRVSLGTGTQHEELVAHPLLSRTGEDGMCAPTDPQLLGVPEDHVLPSEISTERLTARVLKAVTDEENGTAGRGAA